MKISDERPLFEAVDVENVEDKSKEDEKPEKTETFEDKRHRWEDRVEWALYNSRWILSIMYFALIAVLVVILIKFGADVVKFIASILWGMPDEEWIIQVLELLDITLVAILVLIVAFSGYENFVSKIDKATGGQDNLPWMGELDFSGLKLKIIGSIVAISLIELLQDFLNATSHIDPNFEMWRIALHLVFVVTGIVFAAMELLSEKKKVLQDEAEYRKKERKIL